MTALILRVLAKLFPVERHEWPKALMLLSIATLLGVGFSVSRAVSEALFLTRFGVKFLPYLQLVNPFLVLIATTIYGVFASRLSNDRLMMYTALLPVPLIVLMRLLILLDMSWVYFMLFAFVLAYAAVLTTSWSVYLPGHYDVQEAKRLLPFISSGLLIGTVAGGVGVALCVPLIGAANVLFLWIVTLLAVIAVVQAVTTLYTPMETGARMGKRGVQKKPGLLSSLKEGVVYSRSSALFLTTTMATIATMMALQLIDFEYSKIFARKFVDSADLTAFLGIVDGLTTIVALLAQWFIVPQCIRRMGVQGTNLLFPYILAGACSGLLVTPGLGAGIFARFTRNSLMPSLRGTTRTLILNALPRKTGALVRSFNTGVVLPLGQAAGAICLVSLKGLNIQLLFPALGLLLCAWYIFYTYKQTAAYGEALLELLREDKIHLLDLGDEALRQLDTAAVAAISERLSTDQTLVSQAATELAGEQGQFLQEVALAHEEVTLAAIELLRTIASPQAFAALQQHLPYASPRLTAAALEALATIGGARVADILVPYLDDAQPQVRVAAVNGLRHVRRPALRQQMEKLLDDPDVRVRAVALAVVLEETDGPVSGSALRLWEAMLDAPDKEAQIAGLSVFPSIPNSPLLRRVYRALDHADRDIRHEAARVLCQLAQAGHITEVDSAVLRSLEDEDRELRELALQVLTAIGTATTLDHILVLLDDEQPRVREALVQSLKSFGRQAIEPLLACLRSPQSSLQAKETALVALARLHGVQPDQLLPFWEAELHDVYRYKLMLTWLEEQAPHAADTFLGIALRDASGRILSLLVQLLAVWTSPEVARLVDSGLHDTDRQKRAQALEALESLSERRFTRLFLPILEAETRRTTTWRDVAQHQWNLQFTDISEIFAACIQSSHKWIVIGALLAKQARLARRDDTWTEALRALAETADDDDLRRTAQHLLGSEEQGLPLTEILLFLKRIPLFSSMSLDQLRTIADHLAECHVQAGEEIFHEGDLSYDLYLIVSGKVDIVLPRGDTDRVIATLTSGDFFGEMANFEDRPRSATAVATEPTRLLMLSAERFRQIVLQEPAISFEIFRELCARLRRFEEEEMAAH
jgi:HEAT repeat protein